MDRVKCDGYHDPKERRRRPDLYNYSAEPCPKVYERDLSVWYAVPSVLCPSLEMTCAAWR
jgi:hypothetical protein